MEAMIKYRTMLCLICYAVLTCTVSMAAERDTVVGELGKGLDDYLTKVTPFGFSGTLLVAKNGTVVLNKGYGMANRVDGLRNTSETIFSAGSITKQFTAAAIMTLEMAGMLNTNDPMSKYLDGVPLDKSDITLHHLLTHTSGLVPDVGGDYEMAERDNTIRRILTLPLEFAPGERFEYSNVNYTLLAAIIEKLSGQTYEAYLREHLFKPANMMWTGYRVPMWTERVVARWYVGDTDNGNSLQRPFPYWNLIGNGGILTTTEDMYQWHLGLLGDKILSAEAKKKLFTPFLNDYAYGWDVLQTDRGMLIQHNGGSELGNNAEIRRYIDSNIVTILFCNQFYQGRPLIDAVRRKIEKIVFGGKIPLPPAVSVASPARLKKFAGQYKLPSGHAFLVSVAEDGLLIAAEGQDAISLVAFPEGKDPAPYKRIGATSAKVLQAALKGDLKPLSKVMENKEKRLEGVRTLLQRRLREEGDRIGNIRDVQTMTTMPSAYEDGGVEVCVEVKGERGSFFFRLIWQGEKNIGIGPMEAARRVEFLFFPLSSTYFAGYDLGIGQDVRLRFDSGSDSAVAGLTVEGKGKGVRALKMTR